MLNLLAVVDDPAKEAVLKFLGSYLGLSAGVAFLISGLKALWKGWVEHKEPILAIILTFVLGIVAKLVMPDIYGPHTIQSWSLHVVILLFVAIGAGAFHDYVINAVVKKVSG
jgi:DMSO reductase anchor subunit